MGNNVERERTPIEDISLADVQHATQSAVSNGAGRIPDEMFGYEEAMNIADAVVNNQYLGTTMQPLRTTARERIMAIDPARWTNPTIAIRVDENNNNNNF